MARTAFVFLLVLAMIVPGASHMMFGRTAPSLDYLGFVRQATGSATPNHTGMAFGIPSGTRRLVASSIAFGPPSGAASACIIGGISATIHLSLRNANGTIISIASAVVPTGTSGNVQFTYPSATSNAGSFCWLHRVDGMISGTPSVLTDVASPFTQNVTCNINSAIIGVGTWYQNGATGPDSWSGTSGITKDDGQVSGGLSGAGSVGSILTPSALTAGAVTYSPVTTNAAQMGVVVFT